MYTTKNPDGTWTGCDTIADRLGLIPQTVRNILIAKGVTMRNATESHSGGKRCKPIKNVPPEGQEPPLCKCDCGNRVEWNQRKNRWNVYTKGHYRNNFAYKNYKWLRHEYEALHRTADDIGKQFGVNRTTIYKQLHKFGIPVRSQSESLKLSGNVRGKKNPAWKGGVAEWGYSYDWKSIAREVRMRDKYTCQSCKSTKKRWGNDLHVHHINQDKTDNSLSNLVSLCAQCHHEVHSGKRNL
jgi:hypothetical protein